MNQGPHRLAVTIRKFIADDCFDLAAGLTYYALLSVFPVVLALVSLFGVVGQAETTTEAVLTLVHDISPGVTAFIRPVVASVVESPAAGLTLVIGFIVAIWSASNYVGAFSRAMNTIHEVEENRPLWKLKPMFLLTTIAMLLLTALMGVLLVLSGPIARSIGSLVGLGQTTVEIWNIARWPVLIFFVVLLIATLYFVTPNVQRSRFRWMSLGAFIALIMVALVSLGFTVYINNFSKYNALYGAIGGVIVALVWLWFTNLSLLFGAEIDAVSNRDRRLRTPTTTEESGRAHNHRH